MADSEATIEELKQQVSKFCSAKDLSLGIITEAAELAEQG